MPGERLGLRRQLAVDVNDEGETAPNRVVDRAEVIGRREHRDGAIFQQLDQSFRTKSGFYSARGGNRRKGGGGRARLAIFLDATLPYELSEGAKLEVGRELQAWLVSTYGCAVLVAWHSKNALCDHFHMLVSTKEVDANGVGPTIRAFNGIACNASKEGAENFAEVLRRVYAEILTRRTGIAYDHRSFRRQGRDEVPVAHLGRQTLRREAEAGTNIAMTNRRDQLAARQRSSRPAIARVQTASAHRVMPVATLATAPIHRAHTISTPNSGEHSSRRARSEDERIRLMAEKVNRQLRESAAVFEDEQKQIRLERASREAASERRMMQHAPPAAPRVERQAIDTSISSIKAGSSPGSPAPTSGVVFLNAKSHGSRNQKHDLLSSFKVLSEGEADTTLSGRKRGEANALTTNTAVAETAEDKTPATKTPAAPATKTPAASVTATGQRSVPCSSERERSLARAPASRVPNSQAAATSVESGNETPVTRADCVLVAAWHLRSIQSYDWEEELATLAGMDLLAFRAAVNQRAERMADLPIADIRRALARRVSAKPLLARYVRPQPRNRPHGRTTEVGAKNRERDRS